MSIEQYIDDDANAQSKMKATNIALHALIAAAARSGAIDPQVFREELEKRPSQFSSPPDAYDKHFMRHMADFLISAGCKP